jgi:hypothetical protein
MTFPNDSHSSATAGTTFATHLANSKEYPVGMMADSDGHIRGSLPAFGLVVPVAAVGAGKIYFDLHTTTSRLRVRSLFAIVATDVAVTGVLGVRLDTMRTSAVGTGGTAATTTASASKTAAGFYPLDGSTALPAGITARAVPAGGATDEQWLWPTYVFTEETNMSSHMSQFFNLVPQLPAEQALELPAGKGLKVVQGSVASVGNVGFLVVFTVE